MIKKKSLAEQVAERIREHIKDGLYPLETQLPTEPDLMKVFGVGRSSIREATKILSNSGFLHVKQGVGAFVISVDGKESLHAKFERAKLLDILEVRRLLETKIAEKAAENRKKKDIEAMEAKLAERYKYAQEGDVFACIKADIEFHQAVADACGNNILAELYRASSVHVVDSFTKQYIDTGAFLETHDLHKLFCDAIREQDVKKTLSVLQQIIAEV